MQSFDHPEPLTSVFDIVLNRLVLSKPRSAQAWGETYICPTLYQSSTNLGRYWYPCSMRVSVDKVGRIVIPKRLRDQAGIGAETELDIVFDGVAITLEPVVTHERIIDRRDGLPLLRAVPDGVLTDDVVRALRDEQR